MLMVLMTGARAYQGVRDAVENHYSEDTCLSYITMKVRHYDVAGGAVYIGDIGGVPALMLSEEFDGARYVTAIYQAGGYVKELFTEDGLEFEPEFGLDVLAVRSLSFNFVRDDLLEITCTGTGGARASTYLNLRSAGVVR
jgi:hypothetical protein